jgi:hypothetical protein
VLLCDRPVVSGATLNAVILEKEDVRLVGIDDDVGDAYRTVVATLRKIAADRHLDDDYYRD